MKRRRGLAARRAGALCLLALAGCGADDQDHRAPPPAPAAVVRAVDEALIRDGEQVYQRHCAYCHGIGAEGNPHWRERGLNGFWPPPPLNGAGHAWHHSWADLRDFIRNGSVPGEGQMPAWKDRLDEREIRAVIAWFQSLWPDEIYAAWYRSEQLSRQGE